MVKLERIDVENSFITIFRFINGNEAQEIQVYTWEADAIETKVKNVSLATIGQLYNKSGTTLVKDWDA